MKHISFRSKLIRVKTLRLEGFRSTNLIRAHFYKKKEEKKVTFYLEKLHNDKVHGSRWHGFHEFSRIVYLSS